MASFDPHRGLLRLTQTECVWSNRNRKLVLRQIFDHISGKIYKLPIQISRFQPRKIFFPLLPFKMVNIWYNKKHYRSEPFLVNVWQCILGPFVWYCEWIAHDCNDARHVCRSPDFQGRFKSGQFSEHNGFWSKALKLR